MLRSLAFMTLEKRFEKLQVFWASLGTPRDSGSKTNWLEKNVPIAEHLQRKELQINPACGSKALSALLKLAVMTLKWWPGCFYFGGPLEISLRSWIGFFNTHESFSRYAQIQTKDKLKQTTIWPLTTARLSSPAQRRMFVSLDADQARWGRFGHCTHMQSVTATYYWTRKIRSGSTISSGFAPMATGTSTILMCTWSVLWLIFQKKQDVPAWQPPTLQAPKQA